MKIIFTVLGYLKWHYGKAIYSLGKIWKNFLNFLFDLFSINLLFKNFFDPWKRMDDTYPKSFNIKEYFYAFLTNSIVRIVGMLTRTFFIIIGLLSLTILTLLYPVIIIIWLLLPFIILALMGIGLLLILK